MKMKKIIIFCIIGIVVFCIGGLMITLYKSQKRYNIGEFNLSEYEWEITTYPSNKNVGQIDEAKIAVEKAKKLWIEEFSVIGGRPYNPINGEKIEVSYDSENNCWHINGTTSSNIDGGVPHALIQRDGKVLAIWYDD